MDANKIIKNEDVVKVTEEITNACLKKGIKVTAGIGAAIIVGGLAYKFIVKPTAEKIKAKKIEQAEENPEDYIEVFDDDEEEPKDET